MKPRLKTTGATTQKNNGMEKKEQDASVPVSPCATPSLLWSQWHSLPREIPLHIAATFRSPPVDLVVISVLCCHEQLKRIVQFLHPLAASVICVVVENGFILPEQMNTVDMCTAMSRILIPHRNGKAFPGPGLGYWQSLHLVCLQMLTVCTQLVPVPETP